MPDPSNYKDKNSYLEACIPKVIEDGTAKDNDQAVAICNSMWSNKKELEMKIKTGKLTRDFQLDIRELDKEKRTIPLSFSSEEPVERFFGIEILDHNPESVKTDRLKKGVPILLNHDRDKQIGILENPEIASDRRGRGIARFGQSQLATEVWQDIQDGIRKDVSVGYRIHNLILEEQKEEISIYRATSWEPLEVSIVSIPADINVGIGRGEGNEFDVNIEKKEIKKMAEEKVSPPVDIDAIMKQATEKENLRVSEIMALGQKAGKFEEAMKYIKERRSIEEFRSFILEDAVANMKPIVKVGQDRSELEPFKAFSEYLFCVRHAPNDPRMRPLYNDKVGEQYIKTVGHERALSMGVGTAGGFAVPAQFMPQLRQLPAGADAIIRPRATVIPAGSPPDAAITGPAIDQGTTHGMFAGFSGQWISEGYAKPETDAFLREITLEPHEWAATLVATDKLLRNWDATSAFVEMLARRALIGAEEMAFISGNGVGKPLGFINAANTSAVVVTRNTANQVLFVDVYTMYSRLYGMRAIWLASPTTKPQLIPMVDAASNLVWQPSAREGEPTTLMGLPIYWYDRMPGLGSRGDIVLVNLEYYLIKDGSGPFFGASDQVYYTSNRTVFKIFFNVDGQPWLTEQIPLEGSTANTVSPFVILL